MADFFFHLLNWETLKVVLFFFFNLNCFLQGQRVQQLRAHTLGSGSNSDSAYQQNGLGQGTNLRDSQLPCL